VRRSCRGKTNFGNLCNSCSPAPSGMELILPAMRKVSPSGRQRRSQRADGRPERKPVACGRKTSGTTAAVPFERRSWWRAARLEEGRGAGSGGCGAGRHGLMEGSAPRRRWDCGVGVRKIGN
jgi:hypothetical protein